jgi:hypothetical protein
VAPTATDVSLLVMWARWGNAVKTQGQETAAKKENDKGKHYWIAE